MTTRHIENRLAGIDGELQAILKRVDGAEERIKAELDAIRSDVVRTIGSVQSLREAIAAEESASSSTG